jgi:hypothetical protein
MSSVIDFWSETKTKDENEFDFRLTDLELSMENRMDGKVHGPKWRTDNVTRASIGQSSSSDRPPPVPTSQQADWLCQPLLGDS